MKSNTTVPRRACQRCHCNNTFNNINNHENDSSFASNNNNRFGFDRTITPTATTKPEQEELGSRGRCSSAVRRFDAT